MNRVTRVAVVAALLGLTALGAAQAPREPSPEALIEKGLKEYKEGKVPEAVASLQAAISQMQKAEQRGMAKFLPATPAGWEAGEIETSSGSFAGGTDVHSITQLSRTYTRKDGDGLHVVVEMMTNKELVETQRTLAETYRSQPELLKAMQTGENKFQLIERDGWIGWRSVQKGSEAQIIVISKGTMLNVRVSKDDEQVLDTFFRAIDLKGLAGARPAPASTPAPK